MAKAKPVTGLNISAPTGLNARIIARTRLEELYSWEAYVENPYNVHELHNMRIAAKRLRYTLEIFADALPLACGPVVHEVEQLQEELGSLHDTDVLIALLRLSLGSQIAGEGYEYLLAHAQKKYSKGRFELNPDLVKALVEPAVAPSGGERQGLEHLLQMLQNERSEYYATFHQHWSLLQERNFQQEVLAILEE